MDVSRIGLDKKGVYYNINGSIFYNYRESIMNQIMLYVYFLFNHILVPKLHLFILI